MAEVPTEQQELVRRRRLGTAAALLALVVLVMLLVIVSLSRRSEPPTPPGPTVFPGPGGVTHSVGNLTEWNTAVQAARPGDVIRLTATINGRLVYRGPNDTGTPKSANGTAAAPIVITADPGVWVDPGNTASNQGALDVLGADHVHVVGVRVRNAQFGVRCQQCRGTSGSPVRIAFNTVTNVGHAGIHIAGHWSDHDPSQHILVEGNVVSYTGLIAAAYGEGIYLGHGGTEWVDVTSNVTVRGNEISYTRAEGVDVKPGTRDILVEGNLIHDLAPVDGGAISAHYVNATPNPHISQLDQVIVRGNRIWNQNLNGVSGANDWAIWVGHGGVEVRNNLVWGLRNLNGTRAVRVRATQNFGPHPIVIADNIFWTTKGWVAEGTPSGASNVQAWGNRGPDSGSNEIVVSAEVFLGPVPALGVASTADSGGGAGTGFAVVGSSTTTTTTTTSTGEATTTAPTAAVGSSTMLRPIPSHAATTVFASGDTAPESGSDPARDPASTPDGQSDEPDPVDAGTDDTATATDGTATDGTATDGTATGDTATDGTTIGSAPGPGTAGDADGDGDGGRSTTTRSGEEGAADEAAPPSAQSAPSGDDEVPGDEVAAPADGDGSSGSGAALALVAVVMVGLAAGAMAFRGLAPSRWPGRR